MMNCIILTVFCLVLCTCCARRLASQADHRKQKENRCKGQILLKSLLMHLRYLLKTAGKSQPKEARNCHPVRGYYFPLLSGTIPVSVDPDLHEDFCMSLKKLQM